MPKLKFYSCVALIIFVLIELISLIFENQTSVVNDQIDEMKSISFIHNKHYQNIIYPSSRITRFTIPANLVKWSEKFIEYLPPFYESPNIFGKPYADPAIDDESFKPKWNEVDGDVNRVSFHGPYEIRDKYPLNPYGRTGIIGRGLLGRWGPNHAADPIVTKWKRDTNGSIVKHSESQKNILQMVAIQRRDNSMWAIPGGMVDSGEKVTNTLKREFIEEALNGEKVQQIEEFFDKNGIEIYCGYVDDPRNTDNAWMETVAYNFHDETGDVLGDIVMEAGDDAKNVQWQDIDQHNKLYGSHVQIVERVAQRLNAHW